MSLLYLAFTTYYVMRLTCKAMSERQEEYEVAPEPARAPVALMSEAEAVEKVVQLDSV
jgi:hypothetical protein